MDKLSKKEIEILRFIRSQRHKTTVSEIARSLQFADSEVEIFVKAMLARDLIRVVAGATPSEDAYYTNPEFREKIFELLG